MYFFFEKLIHNLTDSSYPSNHQRSTCKESQGNIIAHRFLPGILFHTQSKDGANTIIIWSPQRNCYSYNDILQKH